MHKYIADVVFNFLKYIKKITPLPPNFCPNFNFDPIFIHHYDSSESTFENVPSFVFSMISVPYIAFTASTSTEEMGLPLHANTMLIIPDVHCEMACFILSVRSSSLTSSRHECWVCDGWEVKQPLHSRFISTFRTNL